MCQKLGKMLVLKELTDLYVVRTEIVILLIVLMEFVVILLVMATVIDVMLQVQKEYAQKWLQIARVIVMFVVQVTAQQLPMVLSVVYVNIVVGQGRRTTVHSRTMVSRDIIVPPHTIGVMEPGIAPHQRQSFVPEHFSHPHSRVFPIAPQTM